VLHIKFTRSCPLLNFIYLETYGNAIMLQIALS